MDGDAQLDAMIASLRGIGRELRKQVAAEAATLLEAHVQGTAAAGTDPDGKPWPAKRDGSRALPNAARAIKAAALETVIVLTLSGPYVFHNSAAGEDRRRILPETGAPMPRAFSSILLRVATKAFQRATSRGR